MTATEALAEFDKWMADNTQRAKDAADIGLKYVPMPYPRKSQPGTKAYRDFKSRGFKNGPWPKDKVDAFIEEMRQLRAEIESCPDCQRKAKMAEVWMTEPICSLHMGWGHAACWRRDEDTEETEEVE